MKLIKKSTDKFPVGIYKNLLVQLTVTENRDDIYYGFKTSNLHFRPRRFY